MANAMMRKAVGSGKALTRMQEQQHIYISPTIHIEAGARRPDKKVSDLPTSSPLTTTAVHKSVTRSYLS
jgi:hypothetical protein